MNNRKPIIDAARISKPKRVISRTEIKMHGVIRNAGVKNQCPELKAAASNPTISVSRNNAVVENCGLRSSDIIRTTFVDERPASPSLARVVDSTQVKPAYRGLGVHRLVCRLLHSPIDSESAIQFLWMPKRIPSQPA
jgi:hypothetical protein